MAITQEERFHGAAILRVTESITKNFPKIFYSLSPGITKSAYTLKLNYPSKTIFNSSKKINIGIYIKVAHARRSPWRYTFKKNHQEEIEMLSAECNEVYIVFAAGEDGFTCLNFGGLKEILDDKYDESEWVSISRKLRESYRVSGKDGKLNRTLKRNFPDQIIDYIRKNI